MASWASLRMGRQACASGFGCFRFICEDQRKCIKEAEKKGGGGGEANKNPTLFNIAEFTASILTMSLNLHNEIWLSLITILDPVLDGWELRWFCWLQGFNVAFQNLMWFSLPSINWKTPEVLQLFLKDNTFKIALVGWRKVIKARREALNNSWDSDMFSS